MYMALAAARQSLSSNDVPVGAVVIADDGTVLGTGWNQREATGDPTAHAEVVALRAAAAKRVAEAATSGSDVVRRPWDLSGTTLVVTLEPCAMCAGALLAARVDRLVFGAWDEKAGAAGSVWDLVRDVRGLYRAEVYGGVRAAESAALLQDFFAARR